MEADILQQYRTIRLSLAEGRPVAVLHIGAQQTALATGTGAEAGKVMQLAIGSRRTAAEFFRHTPPTPGEIENAIQQVEDEVTRAKEMVADHPLLVTTDASIREIARIAGVGTEQRMPVDGVEQVFSLLAGYSLGRPAASAGIPGSPEFAATLLILREFMHHLGCASIDVMA